VVAAYDSAKRFLGNNCFRTHSALIVGKEKNIDMRPRRLGRLENCNRVEILTSALDEFLIQCKEELEKVEVQLLACLFHEGFNNFLCPHFTADMFWNDLNLALADYKMTQPFIDEVESIFIN
jgi:hypothetical protein